MERNNGKQIFEPFIRTHPEQESTMDTHPLIAAARDLAPMVRAAADEIERTRKVPDEIVEKLSDAGFFRVAVPKEYGGDETDLLVVFDALEELARADASTAWITLIIFANPWLFGNAMQESFWRETFAKNPDLRSAGHIGPNGQAREVAGGYQVSGHWKYGSGCEHSEYLLSGCMVFDGDRPRMSDGQPEMVWIVHRTEDCEILTDSWNTLGLCGSGSHDYVIEDLFVPAEWTLRMGDTVHKLGNPVYTFPGIAFSQMAAITCGMARAAIDIVREEAQLKRRGPVVMAEDSSVQAQVARAEALCGASRAYMKEMLGDVLDTLGCAETLSMEQRARFRLAATNAVDCSVEAVDMMAKVSGGGSVYKGNRLERILRDAHTAVTHLQFNDLTYIKAGRLLLDRDPQDPLF
jgi:alkylation response protein AidB-like acyl-CoA dehydrogenase